VQVFCPVSSRLTERRDTSPVEPGARIAFELTSKQGAALITNHPTYREDIERERRFVNYTKKHHKSWVEFAREQDHGENIRPVLVTGVDLTREFATIAYSDNQTHMECEFSVGVPAVASTSVSVWGSWRTQGLVHTNCGPYPSQIPENLNLTDSSASESAIPDEYNHCVFVRYYTLIKLGFIPLILKAGAGPHQLPKENLEDGTAGKVVVAISDDDDDSMVVDCTETSPSVTHNVPLVGPELRRLRLPLLTSLTKDDRDGFDVVAEFILQVRTSSRAPLVRSNTQTEIRRDVSVTTSSRYSRPSPGMFVACMLIQVSHSSSGERRRDNKVSGEVCGSRTG